jgi:hypothetical protein
VTQSSQQATHSRPGEPHSRAVPTWRDAFDAMMRPLAIASEAWVQTDTFMNALAVTWKIQRQAALAPAGRGLAGPGTTVTHH